MVPGTIRRGGGAGQQASGTGVGPHGPPSTCPAALCVLLTTLRVEAVSFLSQCFP